MITAPFEIVCALGYACYKLTEEPPCFGLRFSLGSPHRQECLCHTIF